MLEPIITMLFFIFNRNEFHCWIVLSFEKREDIGNEYPWGNELGEQNADVRLVTVLEYFFGEFVLLDWHLEYVFYEVFETLAI